MATLEDRLTLAAFNAATQPQAGDVRVVWGQYTGNGAASSGHMSLTFPGRPLAVYLLHDGVSAEKERCYMYYGNLYAEIGTDNDGRIRTDWRDNKVSWFSVSITAPGQMNTTGEKYHYTALIGM